MLTDHEKARIAHAANALRPDWPVSSLLTLLARPQLATRPRRDVAVALTWVACDEATKTPARVLEAGPWWVAWGDGIPDRAAYDRNATCSVCGEPRERCRQRWATDHEFVSVAEARARRTGRPKEDA